MRQISMVLRGLVVAAGVWLGVMENVLRHPGFGARTVVAACIALQGLVTLLYLDRGGGRSLRWGIAVGALAVMAVGGSAAIRILKAPHFEGFVLIIGVLLVGEGFSTLLSLVWVSCGAYGLKISSVYGYIFALPDPVIVSFVCAAGLPAPAYTLHPGFRLVEKSGLRSRCSLRGPC